jgi:DNA-binding GntR family transcriptional regulator
MNSINSKINYNVKLQCHKCCNEFKREFEAYEHQVNIHKLEFAQDIDHVSNFLVSADNDTVVLYIDTTKDVEDEEMEVEETWEKLAIYKWQDQQDFKEYLKSNNIYCHFEISPKRKLHEITLVDEKTQKENDEEEEESNENDGLEDEESNENDENEQESNENEVESDKSQINYNVKLQCHKCFNEFNTEFEAYEHQVNIHNVEFAQDIDHVSYFLTNPEMRVIPENDTFALYIDTTKDVEDEEMEVDTFEKLGIYILQDEQNFKEYLQRNNIVNFDKEEEKSNENDGLEENELESDKYQINYNVKLQCHKCFKEFKTEFEAYKHQVNIHKVKFAQDFDNVWYFEERRYFLNVENDTIVLYIETTKDVEDEEIKVEETWEKLGKYIWQNEQDFKEYLQCNYNKCTLVDEKTQKENDPSIEFINICSDVEDDESIEVIDIASDVEESETLNLELSDWILYQRHTLGYFDFTNNELGPKSKIMQDFRKKLKRERKRQNKKRKI